LPFKPTHFRILYVCFALCWIQTAGKERRIFTDLVDFLTTLIWVIVKQFVSTTSSVLLLTGTHTTLTETRAGF